MNVYNKMGKKQTVYYLFYGDKGKTRNQSLSNELGSLAQGNNFGVKGTYTIDFIPRSEIPQGRDITYANFFFDYIPMKYEPN